MTLTTQGTVQKTSEQQKRQATTKKTHRLAFSQQCVKQRPAFGSGMQAGGRLLPAAAARILRIRLISVQEKLSKDARLPDNIHLAP